MQLFRQAKLGIYGNNLLKMIKFITVLYSVGDIYSGDIDIKT